MTATPKDMKLVGREWEFSLLRGWLDAARDSPSVVVVAGEPGIGKTSVVRAALDRVSGGGLIRWARGMEEGAPPFALCRQLLPEVFDPDGDAGASIGASSATSRSELQAAASAELAELAGGRQIVLVVDDAHWADGPSLAVLAAIVVASRDRPLSVVLTLRTATADEGDGWRSSGMALLAAAPSERLDLSGLSETACAEWLTAVGRDPAGAADLHKQTAGTPLFVREVLRLPDGPKAIHIDQRPPGLVAELVRARTSRLSPAASAFLAGAALLGFRFDIAVAARLVGFGVLECLPLLDECRGLGLLTISDDFGAGSFSHDLLRSAVVSSIPVAQRASLHRAAAEAIEALYADDLEPRLADIAAHWTAVVNVYGPANATRWSVAAGDAALRSLAFEEASRLYRRALALGASTLSDTEQSVLNRDLAVSASAMLDLPGARVAAHAASAAAARADDPELLCAAALALDPIGDRSWDRDVLNRCREALAALPADRLALRARLLAHATQAQIYSGEDDQATATSSEALDLAERACNTGALVSALRARQLACCGPEHVDLRARLAERMIGIGVAEKAPQEEMWGRLWQIDVHWERAELRSVAEELGRLAWCVDRVGTRVARWHLLVARAAHAQAVGNFDAALANAREGFALIDAVGHPAFGTYLSLIDTVGHHIGYDQVRPPMGVSQLDADVDPTQVRATLFMHLGPARVMAESGYLDAARLAYRRAGPPATWDPPPYFRLTALATGLATAVALGEYDDARMLVGRLEPERGRQLVVGAGVASYSGPVELVLGQASAALGDDAQAQADLTIALDWASAIGAVAVAVEAACGLAQVLARRRGVEDRRRAVHLAGRARGEAERMGMRPWVAAADVVLANLPGVGASASDLSDRELEVAALVADGASNREIGRSLYISERTAQNHVQHILTKLGFTNRAQIAAWNSAADRPRR